MEKGITKQINIMFQFDESGKVIDGMVMKMDASGKMVPQKDSRFLGVTFFNELGEKSFLDGKSPVISVPYAKMTDAQKEVFDNLIASYLELKDQE